MSFVRIRHVFLVEPRNGCFDVLVLVSKVNDVVHNGWLNFSFVRLLHQRVQSFEHLWVLLLDHRCWRVKNCGAKVGKSSFDTHFWGFVWKLSNGEVNKIKRSDLLVIDVIPELLPNHHSRKWTLDFVHVQFESLNRFWVKSDFGVGVVSLVDQESWYRLINIYLNLCKLRITLNCHILNDVLFEILVIKGYI